MACHDFKLSVNSGGLRLCAGWSAAIQQAIHFTDDRACMQVVLAEETRFSCVMGKFDLKQGIAASEFIFAESEYLVADGTATIDLPAGELDVAITPRSKRRTFQLPGPIRVSGPIDDPRISTAPISTAVDTSAQVLLFAPSLAMTMFGGTVNLFDQDKSEASPEEEPPEKCPWPEMDQTRAN